MPTQKSIDLQVQAIRSVFEEAEKRKQDIDDDRDRKERQDEIYDRKRKRD